MNATTNGGDFALTSENGLTGLVVNGAVTPATVPEPGSVTLLALLGLACSGETIRRRFRRVRDRR